MKHDTHTLYIQPDNRIPIGWRNAYHQAGRAAAIYLGNQRKQLPPVHFEVSIKPQEHNGQQIDRFASVYCKNIVKVEGGRLIQSLPVSFAEATQSQSWFQQAEYRCAFEADVINLLAGPLAEAKYIASRDDETFTANIVNLSSLRFYGGSSDMELVNEYMACYLPQDDERRQKLAELFLAAFNFVDDSSNWRKITALAEFIRDQTKTAIIQCEDVVSLLDSDVPLRKTEPFDLQTMALCR